MTEKIDLMWVDNEHLDNFSGTIFLLNRRGFNITEVTKIDNESIVTRCKNMDGMIIHCGTVTPLTGIEYLLTGVRKANPNIQIGLQTNVKKPSLENLNNFYLNFETLEQAIQVIKDNVKKINPISSR